MPVYEYLCENCGHELEKLSKINDFPPECPECKTVMIRSVSQFGKKPRFTLSKTNRVSLKRDPKPIPGTRIVQ